MIGRAAQSRLINLKSYETRALPVTAATSLPNEGGWFQNCAGPSIRNHESRTIPGLRRARDG